MRSVWFSRRSLLLHITIIIVVPTFLALCRWQFQRATSGNELSWAYVFEWPFFAGYAVYMWWHLIHENEPNDPLEVQPGASTTSSANQGTIKTPDSHLASSSPNIATRDTIPSGTSESSQEDEELKAYNRYLADLDRLDPAKHW